MNNVQQEQGPRTDIWNLNSQEEMTIAILDNQESDPGSLQHHLVERHHGRLQVSDEIFH